MSYQWKNKPPAEPVVAQQRAFPTRPRLGAPVANPDAVAKPRRRRGLFEVVDDAAADEGDVAVKLRHVEPSLLNAEDSQVTDDLADLDHLFAEQLNYPANRAESSTPEIDLDQLDIDLADNYEFSEDFDFDMDGADADDDQESLRVPRPAVAKPRILEKRTSRSTTKPAGDSRTNDTGRNNTDSDEVQTHSQTNTRTENKKTQSFSRSTNPERIVEKVITSAEHDRPTRDVSVPDRVPDTNDSGAINKPRRRKLSSPVASVGGQSEQSTSAQISATSPTPDPYSYSSHESRTANSSTKPLPADPERTSESRSRASTAISAESTGLPVNESKSTTDNAQQDTQQNEQRTAHRRSATIAPRAITTASQPDSDDSDQSESPFATTATAQDHEPVADKPDSGKRQGKAKAATMAIASRLGVNGLRANKASPSESKLGRYSKAIQRMGAGGARRNDATCAPVRPTPTIESTPSTANATNNTAGDIAQNNPRQGRRIITPRSSHPDTAKRIERVKFRNIDATPIDVVPEQIRQVIPEQIREERAVNKLIGANEQEGTYTVFLPKLDTPKEKKPFGHDPVILSLMIFSVLFLLTAGTGFLMSRDEGADRWIAKRVANVKEQATELATSIQNLTPAQDGQLPEAEHSSSIQPVSPQQPMANAEQQSVDQPEPAIQPATDTGTATNSGAVSNLMTGTLISSNGEPVAGEQIVLTSPTLGVRFTTTTRDDGEFVLENLMPGNDYSLSITPSGPYKTLEVLDLTVSQNNAHLPLTLEAMPTANLSGRIVDADNNVVPNYQLWASGFDDPGQQVNFRSDHEGNYRLFGLPTGKVQFTSKSDPKILITSVVLTGGADEVVDLVVDYGPHQIGGIATNADGNALSGVEITLEWSVKRGEIRSMGTRTTSSGEDGSFRFTDLGPGKHFLTARADGLPLIRRSIDVGTDETEIALALGGVDDTRLN